jgi:hypothetical protein
MDPSPRLDLTKIHCSRNGLAGARYRKLSRQRMHQPGEEEDGSIGDPAQQPNSKLEAACHKADEAIRDIVDLLVAA